MTIDISEIPTTEAPDTDGDETPEAASDGQPFGLAAALRALNGGAAEEADTDDEPTDADDDEPEAKADKKPEAKPEDKRRSVVDEVKRKRRENKALRSENAQLAARLRDLEAKVNAPGAGDAAAKLAEIERLAKENPDALLRRYGVDTSAYYETLTKRQLQKGNVPPEVLDAVDGLKAEVERLKTERAEERKQAEARADQARYEAAARAFETEVTDKTKYPEFEGYTNAQLLQGAQALVEQWSLAGRTSATPDDVAKALHEALAKEHDRIATRKAKGAPAEPAPKGKVKLPPVAPDSGKKRISLPSEKEIERRGLAALNARGLHLTRWSRLTPWPSPPPASGLVQSRHTLPASARTRPATSTSDDRSHPHGGF